MNEINTAVNVLFKVIFIGCAAVTGGMAILSAFFGVGDMFCLFLVFFLFFAMMSRVTI